MTDQPLKLAVLKNIFTGAPVKGIIMDFAFQQATGVWTVICYIDDLSLHPEEQQRAFIKWLWDKAKTATEQYDIPTVIARL